MNLQEQRNDENKNNSFLFYITRIEFLSFLAAPDLPVDQLLRLRRSENDQ